MNIFYIPDAELDQEVQMDGQEWSHCHRSLRYGVDAIIEIVNGRGGFYQGKIIKAGKNAGVIYIFEKTKQQGAYDIQLHMAIAPTKQIARTEWAVEKLVEIGVSEISFVQTEYTLRSKINMDRMEKICISAMKQSLQAIKPIINPIGKVDLFLQNISASKTEQKFIPYVKEETTSLAKNYERGKDVILLIGPEGGFSEKEIEKAMNSNFLPVSLGENRLRTETACITSCQTIHTINQLSI